MVTFPNCKINLGLNIIRKRSDGFHDLETVFYPVMLCDVLEILEKPSDKELPLFANSGLAIDGPSDKNLVVKAYNLLKNDFNLPEVAMYLHKVIPFGAGLGGGSSDAAFALISLNKLFNLNIPKQQLCEYAALLGSDCAFFVQNIPSHASSRGEVLKPINLSLKGLNILLVKPNIHISTAEAYAGVIPKVPEKNLEKSILEPVGTWKNTVVNDFEESLFHKHPKLLDIKNELYTQGALYASMSGSGSTIFGIFKEKIKATSLFPDCFVWDGTLN